MRCTRYVACMEKKRSAEGENLNEKEVVEET
jgi:hypothetical protein